MTDITTAGFDPETYVDDNQSTFLFMDEIPPIGKRLRVGVVGGTGLVGQTLLSVLRERNFPVGELHVFGSPQATARWLETPYGMAAVNPLKPRRIPELDFVFMAAGAAISKRWARTFALKGAFVIDKSSYFRTKPYAPLVIPEVNPEALTHHRGIISSPNCTTIPVAVALSRLNRAFGLRKLTAVSFQSVSGHGKDGIETLNRELEDSEAPPTTFSHRIAGNVIPWIGEPVKTSSSEEWKLMAETRKILALPRLPIRSTSVRVPTRVGHAVAVHADFRKSFSVKNALKILTRTPGVVIEDDPEQNQYPTPLAAEGRDEVFVGRIRRDLRSPRSLAFWVVTDNLRKGAATNAVQIAELLLESLTEPG